MRISDWSSDVCSSDLLAADGRITLVEVKSGIPDFRADGKWHEYLEFCDAFYFAVAPAFPLDLLPDAATCGLIVADPIGRASHRARVCPHVSNPWVPEPLKKTHTPYTHHTHTTP